MFLLPVQGESLYMSVTIPAPVDMVIAVVASILAFDIFEGYSPVGISWLAGGLQFWVFGNKFA